MQRCTGFLFLSLILCAALSETFGLVFSTKEKRGWTLNSAGYLLGPRHIDQLLLIKEMSIARRTEEVAAAYAVDNHRSFNDKHGFTGKREIQPDEDIKAELSLPSDLNVISSLNLLFHHGKTPATYTCCKVSPLDYLLRLSTSPMTTSRDSIFSDLITDWNLGRPLADENIVRTVIEFLTYLHLKEVGALDKLPSPEETNQS